MYLNAINAPLSVLAGRNLNIQPTTLGTGSGIGYGTAGSAISGVNPGPW
jgi:hypothetical protein